jgi:dienelactone hydrolase
MLGVQEERRMATADLSKWRTRMGVTFMTLGLLLAVSMTSALPAVLDVRPYFVFASAAAAVLLWGAAAQVRSRRRHLLRRIVAIVAGVAALATARDLWLVYRTEDVRFAGANGVELGGTLYLPRGGGRHPAVVLMHGAGPDTRHESSFAARGFARHGLVALAYDKTGAGSSGGDHRTAGYEEFASDAVGGVRLLRSRPEVDARRVGILGVSEGEWTGVLAAVQCQPAFLIIVSPSAMTPSEQVGYEAGSNVLRAGFGVEAASRARGLYAKLAQFQRTGAGRDELNRELAAARREPWFDAARYLEESVPEYERVLAIDWFPAWRRRMDFDSLELCSRIACPVLVQNGGSDPKNDGQAAIDRLRAAFARGGNVDFTGILYPSAGHNVIVWPLGDRVPPPWFAKRYLRDRYDWVRRVVGR